MTPKAPNRARRNGCPICSQSPTADHHPFCSARCAEIDLGRWLKGNYAIPTDETPPPSGQDNDTE